MEIKQIPNYKYSLNHKDNYTMLWKKMQNLTKKTDQTCESHLKRPKHTHNYNLNSLFSNIKEFLYGNLNISNTK